MKPPENKAAFIGQHPLTLPFATCLAALACLLPVSSVRAQTTYTWNGNGSGGGSGAWDTTTANWLNGGASVWGNTGGSTGSFASFNGTAGTVTIDAGGLTIGAGADGAVIANVSGYTLTGGALNFVGTGAGNRTVYHLQGTATSLTVNNNTILTTNSPNAGLEFQSFAALENSNSTLTIGGNIGLSGAQTAGVRYLTFLNANGTVATSVEVNGVISNYAGVPAGTGSIALAVGNGNGANLGDISLTLSGNNTYTGPTPISNASVIAKHNNALGTGSVQMDVGTTSLLTGTAVTIGNSVSMRNFATSVTAVIGGSTADTSTFTGNITRDNSGNSQALALTAAAGGTVNFTGVISDGASTTMPVYKIGDGVVKVTRANTYDGGTRVNAGTLLVNNTTGSGVGTGAVTVNSVASSLSTFTRNVGSYSLTVGSTTGLQVGQTVTGTGIQSGTVITAITNGTTLVLNKPATVAGSSSLTFGAASGTLGGIGSIAGAATVNSGAAIAPGDLSTGTLTLQSGLDVQGTYQWEINANSTSSGFDAISLTGGNLALGGASALNITALGGVDFSNAFWTTSQSWNVINNTGSGLLTGTFSGLTGTTSNAYGAFSLSYGAGAGADVTLNWTAVPEPSAFLLLAVGLTGLITFRRRRMDVRG